MKADTPRPSLELLISLLILTAVYAAFGRALQAGFVYWDDNVVYDNPHIRGLDWERIRWMFTDIQYVWRYMPLTWLSLAVTYELFGLNPFGFHLANLLLHGANAVLVFFLLRKLFLLGARKEWTPDARNHLVYCCGLGAMLWTLHPLRVEPVVWVIDRVYGQAILFLLISMLCYLEFCDRSNARRTKHYWSSVIAFAASLLSYQTGLGYVLVLAVLDLYPLRRFNEGKGWWYDATARRLWLEKVPFASAAAVVVVLTLLARFQVGDKYPPPVSLAEFGIAERAMQAFYIWAYYLWRPWFPVDLSPYYTTLLTVEPTAPRFVASAIVVVGLTAWLLFKRRLWPLAWTLWGCHLILLVPVLGLTEHPYSPSDRYGIIAGITWSVLITAGLVRSRESGRLRLVATIAGGAVALGLGILTYQQTAIWQNSVALHEHMLKKIGDHPQRAWLYLRLGRVHLENGNDEQAEKSFKELLRLDPNSAEAHWHLGNILYHRGAAEVALRQYSEALRLSPNDASIHLNTGAALATLGRMKEAAAHFSDAVRLDPKNVNARRNLVRALTEMGMLDEAKMQEREAERLDAR